MATCRATLRHAGDVRRRTDAVARAARRAGRDHVAIFVGHGTMMLGGWLCYQLGYPGVRETLAALGAS